jgi:hypothetical protein
MMYMSGFYYVYSYLIMGILLFGGDNTVFIFIANQTGQFIISRVRKTVRHGMSRRIIISGHLWISLFQVRP